MKQLICACGKGEMKTGCVGNVPVCVFDSLSVFMLSKKKN